MEKYFGNKKLNWIFAILLVGALITGLANYLYRLQLAQFEEFKDVHIRATQYKDGIFIADVVFQFNKLESAKYPVKLWSTAKDGKVEVTVYKQLVKPFKPPQFYKPPITETHPKKMARPGQYYAPIIVGNPQKDQYFYRTKDKTIPIPVKVTKNDRVMYRDIIKRRMMNLIDQVKKTNSEK